MACVNPDGTPSPTARNVLRMLTVPLTVEEIAEKAGLPVFRIRASLRDMTAEGYVKTEGVRYILTEFGKNQI